MNIEGDKGERSTPLRSGRALSSELSCSSRAGRVGATAGLDLRAGAGLEADSPGSAQGRAKSCALPSGPHIYAAGDVIGFPSLASTSMERGRLAACFAFKHGDSKRRREGSSPSAFTLSRR